MRETDVGPMARKSVSLHQGRSIYGDGKTASFLPLRVLSIEDGGNGEQRKRQVVGSRRDDPATARASESVDGGSLALVGGHMDGSGIVVIVR